MTLRSKVRWVKVGAFVVLALLYATACLAIVWVVHALEIHGLGAEQFVYLFAEVWVCNRLFRAWDKLSKNLAEIEE